MIFSDGQKNLCSHDQGQCIIALEPYSPYMTAFPEGEFRT
jgi:hypothetical protein